MQHRLWFIFMLIPIISLSALADTDKVDDYIKAEMQKRHIPGLTLAVIQNGKVIKQQAYGLANIELNVPATTETIYQIASTTKTFTASAIMALVEERKFALDDKVIKLLPELPAAWGDVTVRHCLTHTSGLPDIMTDTCHGPAEDSREDALKRVAGMAMLSKPGEKWSYNQTGYMLLGMIIEKLSGMTFEEFLQRRFFGPLGMTSTRFGDYREIIPGRASLYTRIESCRGDDVKISRDKIYANYQYPYIYKPYTHTGAGLNSTAGDLVKWNLALDAGQVLKKATMEEMWSAVKLNDGKVFRFGGTAGYASGWSVDDQPGHKAVGHSGGASTGYWRYLDDRLTVIVLTNCQGAGPDSIIKGVAALYVPAIAGESK